MYTAAKNRYQTMEYRKCGKSGLRLSAFSLGFWHNFGTNDDYEQMKAMCFTAFDHGITVFDLANNYGPAPGSAEEHAGRIFKEELSAHRDELIITTKAGHAMWEGPYGDGGSRKYLIASLDQSLQRLGLDYVDIFYHHRPDFETPLEETMQALADIVRSGKALYVGLSKYDGERTRRAAHILEELHCPFVVNQSRYSLFDRHIEENGLLAAAKDCGCGIVAFSPLAQGLLSEKYLQGIPADSRMKKSGVFLRPEHLTDDRMVQLQALHALAVSRGQTIAQLALSWVLCRREVSSVLIGASRPEQIQENVQALSAGSLTTDEIREIENILLLTAAMA